MRYVKGFGLCWRAFLQRQPEDRRRGTSRRVCGRGRPRGSSMKSEAPVVGAVLLGAASWARWWSM
jgi:hypothetical protein